MQVFLAPVAAGYVATSQGWRWLFWWCTIFFAINLVLFIFCYEETKYTDTTIHGTAPVIDPADDLKREDSAAGPSGIDHSIPLKSYRERMAFTTNTKGPFSKFSRHMWQPFVILFTFLIAAYCTITVGMCLAWFAIIATTEAQYFAAPPYNFTPVGIGLLNLPGFIGFLIGAIWGGPATDCRLSRDLVFINADLHRVRRLEGSSQWRCSRARGPPVARSLPSFRFLWWSAALRIQPLGGKLTAMATDNPTG